MKEVLPQGRVVDFRGKDVAGAVDLIIPNVIRAKNAVQSSQRPTMNPKLNSGTGRLPQRPRAVTIHNGVSIKNW
jgi:hypothetical protein